ncbi:MAG TPA: hypothetical protein VMG35_06595 [Bryobacteraceae bacterium]|nr:hypothetical protein [Bryobacteraceae bacterium]
MLHTLAKRIRHDEEVLKNTTQSLLESAGIMLISMLALLGVCAFILLLGR